MVLIWGRFDVERAPEECRKMALSAMETSALKKAPAVEGVLPAIHERWSARSFADRDVNAETLRKVFEAARWAASSNNEQPWRFVVGRRGDGTWEKIYATLMGFNRAWAHRAPVLILGTANTRFMKNGAEYAYASYDLGAATALLTLQAAALGLTTHQMAGFDHEAARRELGIPAEYALGTVIALGYQDDPAVLGDATLIERETSARTRKPLNEIVFKTWGEGAVLKTARQPASKSAKRGRVG
jgi:nitroreductase